MYPETARAMALLGLFVSATSQGSPVSALYGIAPDPIEEPQGCDDLSALEPAAMMGRLDEVTRSCLADRQATESKPKVRSRISLLRIQDAQSSNDKDRYAALLKQHLETIEVTGDLAVKYAIVLYRSGQYVEAIRWSEAALEHHQDWSGATHSSRVYMLHKTRTLSLQAVYAASDQPSEAQRQDLVRYARQWCEFAKSVDKDPTRAQQVCQEAGESLDACD